jgi:hypothetical protein
LVAAGCAGELKVKLTSESLITVAVVLTERQVPPLSVKVKRVRPTPASTTSRPPLVSNLRPRGLVRSVAISWAFHPAAATGAEYEGVRTVAHAVADEAVAAVDDVASARLHPSSRAAVAAFPLKRFILLLLLVGWFLAS